MKGLKIGHIIFFLTFLCLSGCEQEFVPEINSAPPDIVVEGYIEGGDNSTTPYVILTRSIPFFSEINLNQVDGFFVHGAEVSVTNSTRTVELLEFCLSELTEAQKGIVADLFGINSDSAGLDFCVYIDPNFSMGGQEGECYKLDIKVEDKLISATTTIPKINRLRDLKFVDVPGVPNDTLRELSVTLDDRPFEKNYYRYFTSTNENGFLAPFQSVFNDLFFDGDSFEFPLPKAEEGDVEFNFETFGYYRVGDTLDLKYCTIDEAHYNFWSTLEFNRANQGPFSSYTAIDYNINGGIGIWGGYASSIQRLIVE